MQTNPQTEFTRRTQEIHGTLRAVMYKVNQAGTDPEDLLQESLLCLWEKALTSPDFLQSTDPYLIQAAKWQAQHYLEHHEYLRTRVMQFEHELCPQTETDEECITGYDTAADLNMSPEKYTLYRDFLNAAQKRLTPGEKTLLHMLYCGYSHKEIAAHFGIQNSTLSMRKRKIAEKLAEYAF
jgi:RNA polymerase sigma factor (sigma-70 family)